MSRLAKIDLVTCGGFEQRPLCAKKTVSVSGVHWNFFPRREEGYERAGRGTMVAFVLAPELSRPGTPMYSLASCVYVGPTT